MAHSVFHVQYDNAFAQNIISSGKCTITRNAIFNNATYDNFIVEDYNSSTFGVMIGQNYTNTNNSGRVLITSTPKNMVHVKMEVTNYNPSTQIGFYTAPDTSYLIFILHSTTINVGFMDTDISTTISLQNPSGNVSLCPKPTITDISSSLSTITAGRNQIITIKGTNFGPSRGGNGGIWFKNADDGGANFVNGGIDKNTADFQVSGTTEYWTNTEIRIKLPSKVKYFDLNKNEWLYFIVGEGKIKVSNPYNSTSDLSPYNLMIDHSYLQFCNEDGSIKKPSYLKTSNISFKLGATLQSNTQAAALVRRALKDWSCHLNISLTENSSSSNLIDFGSSRVEILMFTTIIYNYGNTFNTPTTSSITINNATTFDYSTPGTGINGKDFYAAILHELGHALMLNHQNNASYYNAQLMYFSLPNYTSEVNRQTLNKSSGSTTDANYIAQESKSAGLLSYKTVADVCPITVATPVINSVTCPDNYSVELMWSSVPYATGYILENLTIEDHTYLPLTTIPNNYTIAFTHSGLPTNSIQYYRMRANHVYGYSAYSNEIYKSVHQEVTTELKNASAISNDDITIYPNPASKKVFVMLKRSDLYNISISIQSLAGAVLIETGNFQAGNQAKELDISRLNAGVYLMRVVTGDRIITSKLIIN